MVISPKAKLTVSKQKNQNQGNSNSVITTLAFTHETLNILENGYFYKSPTTRGFEHNVVYLKTSTKKKSQEFHLMPAL